MTDDDGSNPSASSLGVAPVGGRSHREPHQRTDDVCAALEASNGERVSIPGCDEKWPFYLIYRKRQSHTAAAPLHELKLMVIGSTLGGALFDIPSFVLDDFIIVMLPCNKGKQQYGYREVPYNSVDEASWDGGTDMDPVIAFWDIVDCLVELQMTNVMSMVGMSAGVDRCLSLLAHVDVVQPRNRVVCSHFVAICGAYHSFLYKLAKRVFLADWSRIIVVHHVDDTLCRWPEVKWAWEDIRKDMLWSEQSFDTVYIATLEMKQHPFLNKPRHSIDKFVVHQQALWSELKLGVFSCIKTFKTRCWKDWLGHGHMTPPDKQCLEDFVFIISPRQSHLIMYAHILLLALQEARSATSTPAYLRRVVECARLHLSPQGWEKTKKLLEIIPSEHQVMVFRYGLVFFSCCRPF